MSKREDRIREAASLHAKIGQLQRYCELMVELGEVTFGFQLSVVESKSKELQWPFAENVNNTI